MKLAAVLDYTAILCAGYLTYVAGAAWYYGEPTPVVLVGVVLAWCGDILCIAIRRLQERGPLTWRIWR